MVSIDIHTFFFLDNRIGREFIAPACTCGERAKVAGMKQLKIERVLSDSILSLMDCSSLDLTRLDSNNFWSTWSKIKSR